MTDKNILLPIGSIVKLKKSTTPVMVCGITQAVKSKEDMLYADYIGVVYPQGFINFHSMILFNHDSIENVIFRGFEDEKRAAYIEAMKNVDACIQNKINSENGTDK